MGTGEFLEHAQSAVTAFLETVGEKHNILHVSHLDADGLSAAALVVRFLHKQQTRFTTRILPNLDDDALSSIQHESYTHYIFSDFGSGQVGLLKKYITGKHVLILDHHDIDEAQDVPKAWFHINPKQFGLDGNKDISGSGVAYAALCPVCTPLKRFAHVALVGAMGDIQAQDGYSGHNATLLEHATNEGLIVVQDMLKLYGISTRSLAYLLEYSDDLHIPGVYKERGGGVRFLNELGIHTEIGGRETKATDLSSVEFQRLVQAIIKRHAGEKKEQDILDKHYVLAHEKENTALRDLKEFSTLLNACGRMKKYGVGVGACLNDPAFKELAFAVQQAYKQKISSAIRWYHQTQHETFGNVMVINGNGNVDATVIGTLASIVCRQVTTGTYVVAIARTDDGARTKVSVRRSGDAQDSDLSSLVRQLCTNFDAQAGGHNAAAGAVFSVEHEGVFLENVKQQFAPKQVEADVL